MENQSDINDHVATTLPEVAAATSQEISQEEDVGGRPQQDNIIDVPPPMPTTTPQPAAASTSHHTINDQSKVTLYRAALKGDWETAKKILDEHPDVIRASIREGNHTVLHIAASGGHAGFVKKLVSRITSRKDLDLKSSRGFTALMVAVMSGNVEVAKVLAEKERSLPTNIMPVAGQVVEGPEVLYTQLKVLTELSLEDEELRIMRRSPINLAAFYGRHHMVRFLYKSIDVFDQSHLSLLDRNTFFVKTVSMGIYDVALEMLKRHPKLATTRDYKGWTALHAMAQKPQRSAYFPSDSSDQQGLGEHNYFYTACSKMFRSKDLSSEQQGEDVELVTLLWEQVQRELWDSEVKQLLTQPHPPLHMLAAANGNEAFLRILTHHFPDLILMTDVDGQTIFHAAVYYRQEGIFKLICKSGALNKDDLACKIGPQGNTLLHYAAFLPPPDRLNIVSGAALQFQRELLWFKEVKKVVPPYYEDNKNGSGETAEEIFRREHKALMAEGEKWIKDTANSCMLVAALIATVVFAVAFTVPGGNTDSGTPIFLKKLSFKIFSVADGISLISSSTSILTFLSILTSRYTEEDFQWSLPSKLIVGLSTLFISIIAMMAAFGAAFFIIFDEGILGVAIAVAAATCVPVMWYALMLRRVFLDLFGSTFMSTSLFT